MADSGAKGDFKDKQFSESEVASKVVEQYDEEHARIFYKYVMGGGGLDIHYGCYTKGSDTVYESSKETNNRLMTSMHWMRPITKESCVLDLGSGHGGLSHEVALKYGCKVFGLNISPEQNKMNLDEAKKLGVGHLISCELADFNNGLPMELTGKFTHIISCEVLCHAANKPALFRELIRVSQPGAAFAFTDIMGADGADEKVLKDFTDRNATTKMARPSEYMTLLRESGYREVSYLDYSPHLQFFFQGMVDQINKHRDDMKNEGVTDEYLDKWLASLTSRVTIQREHGVFAWGIFNCRLDGPLY
jgi:sarcosine/dimethylglycine N-methyltransferase